MKSGEEFKLYDADGKEIKATMPVDLDLSGVELPKVETKHGVIKIDTLMTEEEYEEEKRRWRGVLFLDYLAGGKLLSDEEE